MMMRTVKASELTMGEIKELKDRGAYIRMYTVNGEKWLYILEKKNSPKKE